MKRIFLFSLFALLLIFGLPLLLFVPDAGASPAEEPLPADSPFWELDNVIITPHYSFNGEFNPIRLFDLLYSDTKKWLETQKG